MTPRVVLKVNDWVAGELIYTAEYVPTPKVLRIVADAIAADIEDARPVTIEINLNVSVTTKVMMA